VTSNNGQTFDIVRAQPDKEKALTQGWLHRDAAAALFTRSGLDLERLKAEARKASFQPVLLKGASLSANYTLTHTRADSHNVIGRLPGGPRPARSLLFAAWTAEEPGLLGSGGERGAPDSREAGRESLLQRPRGTFRSWSRSWAEGGLLRAYTAPPRCCRQGRPRSL
jgi:Zn-dependent M28 family amino/carboxypeptidase